MQPNEDSLINPFGEPLDEQLLLNFAAVDAGDVESALIWWNDNASEDWQGALTAPPFSPQTVVK